MSVGRWAYLGQAVCQIAACVIVLHLAGASALPAEPLGTTVIAKWKDDCAGALSLTFDDNHWHRGLAASIMDQHDVKGTFFAVTGTLDVLVGEGETGTFRDMFLRMYNNGHEIASHTVNHHNLTGAPLSLIETELGDSRAELEQWLGVPCVSFCYPYGAMTPDTLSVARQLYLSARWSQFAGPLYPSVPHNTEPGWDIHKLSRAPYAIEGVYWTDPQCRQILLDYVLDVIASNAWGTESYHDFGPENTNMAYTETVFRDHVADISDPGLSLWVAPQGKVTRYYLEKESTTVQVLSAGTDSISLRLVFGGDPVIYDEPLTVITVIPPSWHGPYIRVRQAGQNRPRKIYTNGPDRFVMYNAMPGGGDVEITATAEPMTIFRSVFYNNCYFDGDDPAANAADDAALAPDNSALLAGGTATFANYTSYSRGINGIMVDFCELPGMPGAGDFSFKVGNDDNPAGWADVPVQGEVTIRHGAGMSGGDRVTITWPDGTIVNTWLQVTVLSTDETGLPADDVFYFGNAIGETGNSLVDANVTPADQIGVRNNPHTLGVNPAGIDDAYDFNRDRQVGPTDEILCRNNGVSSPTALKLISVP